MTPNYERTFDDLYKGTSNWRMWSRLGWMEIRRRYRRTVIGPFWMTLSVAIMIFSMGVIWSNLFNMDMAKYMPYLSISIIIWSMISQVINEGCSLFTVSHNIISTIRVPFSTFACALVWRNLIVFFHNIVVFALVFAIWRVPVGFRTILFIPGLLIFCINAVWVSLLLGTVCTRFRDIGALIGSILVIAMLVTPVFWSADMLLGRAFALKLVEFNPFFHFLEVIRAPLLGRFPTVANWAVCLGVTFVGWGATLYLFSRFRHRIAYWI